MSFQKFTIINMKTSKNQDEESVILLNLRHIISIKPIQKLVDGKITTQLWIKTSNGKKYRASKIPLEVLSLFECEIGENKKEEIN